jgi:uncharacterized lipoprotein YmbA
MFKSLLLGSIILMLSACASTKSTSPEMKFYLLDALPAAISNNATSEISLSKVQVPEYLKQASLIMRTDGQQIRFARYHQWAGNASKAIRRVLIEELNQISSVHRFVDRCGDCGDLQINITHFYPTESGEVFLAGTYSVALEKEVKQKTESFTLSLQMEESGYEHAVFKMRQLLLKLSQRIKHDIK